MLQIVFVENKRTNLKKQAKEVNDLVSRFEKKGISVRFIMMNTPGKDIINGLVMETEKQITPNEMMGYLNKALSNLGLNK